MLSCSIALHGNFKEIAGENMASFTEFFSNLGHSISLYVKKNIVLPIFPDHYKGDVKLEWARNDIDFAKSMLLDADQRKNLTFTQKIDVLKIINTTDPRGRFKEKYKNRFWDTLENQMCMKKNNKEYFPRYLDLVDTRDNPAVQKDNAEKLFDMGLFELKIPAVKQIDNNAGHVNGNPPANNAVGNANANHVANAAVQTQLYPYERVFTTNAADKSRLAKLSPKIAEAICLNPENCGDENSTLTDQHNSQYNLSKTQRADIINYYYPQNNPQPAGQEQIEAVNPAPVMSFWEKLLYAFMPKNAEGNYLDSNYQSVVESNNKKISDANNAMQNLFSSPLPAFNHQRREVERNRVIASENEEKKAQEEIIRRATQEKERYLKKPESADSKEAALLQLNYYLYKNHRNPANNAQAQNNVVTVDYRAKFLELLNVAITRQPAAGTTSLIRQTAVLLLDEHLSESLPVDANNALPADNSLLQNLSLQDLLKLFEFADHNHRFINQLWKYVRLYKINNIMANEAEFNLFSAHLAKTGFNQSAQFLTSVHDKCNIFRFITKLKQLMDFATYNELVKSLVSLLGTDLISNILFNNYANADVITFLDYLDKNRLCPDTFKNIVITLFKKYSKTQLSELMNVCKDNAPLLQLFKQYLLTAGVDIDYNYSEIAQVVMSSTVASSTLGTSWDQLDPVKLMNVATDEQNPISDSTRREHMADILNAANKDGTAAIIFAHHQKSCELAKESLVVADFSFTKNQNSGLFSGDSGTPTGFFNDLDAKNYVVVKLRLSEENKAKIAKFLQCAPEKLQNSLVIFPNNEWKSSFHKFLSDRKITLTGAEWSEVHSVNNKDSFAKHPQFLNLTNSSEKFPLNILIPLPNPQNLLAIYKQLKQPNKTVFYQIAKECHEIIGQVLNLGSSITKRIKEFKELFSSTKEFQKIKFEEPKASLTASRQNLAGSNKATIAPQIVPAAVASAPSTSGTNPPVQINNGVTQVPPGSSSAIHSAPPVLPPHKSDASPPKSGPKLSASNLPDLPDLSEIESLADSLGSIGSSARDGSTTSASVSNKGPSLPVAPHSNGGTGPNLKPPSSPAAQQTAVSPRALATASAPSMLGSHRAAQNGQPPHVLSAPATLPTIHAATPDKKINTATTSNPSPQAKQTPDQRDTISSLSLSNSSKRASDELKQDVIPESINTIEATYEWYSDNKKQNGRLALAFDRIKQIIQRSKEVDIFKKLHDKFLKKLQYEEVAQFLILNEENSELFVQLSQYKTTLSSSGAVLKHAALVSDKVISVIFKIKGLKTFNMNILKELSIDRLDRIYKVLDTNWDDEYSRNILIDYLASLPPLKIVALKADQASLANKLFSDLQIARRVLKDKFIVSAVNLGNAFIDEHFLDLLRNVRDNKTEAENLFANYYFSDENISALTLHFDTFYADLGREFQSFFNEKRIQQAPFSVVKLIFQDDNKKALAAKLLHCSVEQLTNSYLLFSDNEWKKDILGKLVKSGLTFNSDFFVIEYLRNDIDPNTLSSDQATNLKLVTGDDYLTKDLNGNSCSILVPYPDAQDFVTLYNISDKLKNYLASQKEFHRTLVFNTTYLDKVARLGTNILKHIFGENIDNKRTNIMAPELIREYKDKYADNTRSYSVPGGFFRTQHDAEAERQKKSSSQIIVTAKLNNTKLSNFDEALKDGPSVAINKLLQQNLFTPLEKLKIIFNYCANPLFISCLKNEKLWNPKIDVYSLAMSYKDSRLLRSELDHQNALALVIDCNNPTDLITPEQLKLIAQEYISTFGDTSSDYQLLGLDSKYVTVKSLRQGYRSFNFREHVDKKGDEGTFKKKQAAYEKLLNIHKAKSILDEDPELNEWRQPASSSPPKHLFEAFSSPVSSSSSSAAPAAANKEVKKPDESDIHTPPSSSPRPGVSNVNEQD